MPSPSTKTVAGIGELLWDIFPSHQRLGGAPTNFAYHSHQFGSKAIPVSCVGEDSLGQLAIDTLKGLQIETRHIARSQYPTGTVEVTLQNGKPSYQIQEHTAWDHIPLSTELEKLGSTLDALSFGSLCQRSETSRATIQAFLRQLSEHALVIFDVNLRQDFYSREIIESSLEVANCLKLSDEELPVLAELFSLKGDVTTQLESLRTLYKLACVAYTRGGDGSLLLTAEQQDDFAGYKSDVIDTVGAGDAFNAALCHGLLQKWPLSTVNQFANRVAAYVCTQEGATPILPTTLSHFKQL